MNHDDGTPLPGMIGRHPSMREVYRQVRGAAKSELPVVIVGETGTGKELVARALHDLGPASSGPFVDVNCAALPETLAEAELFGAERGAFTGAVQRLLGFLEVADGGTLFLDEACSLSPAIQAKLLRAIEQKTFYRIGRRTPLRSRFRLIAAVSRPLAELLSSGSLRPDFAFRVAGFTITLPPLRARSSDIRLLAEHFLRAANHNGHPTRDLSPEALAFLTRESWPGNVRELKMLMERLVVTEVAPVIGLAGLLAQRAEGNVDRSRDRDYVAAVLTGTAWNVTFAARRLGVSRATLKRRLAEYGLRRPWREVGFPSRTIPVAHGPARVAHEPVNQRIAERQTQMP